MNVCSQDSNSSSDHELYKRMTTFSLDDPEVLSRDPSVHLSKVLSDKYAFFTDSPILEVWAAQHCELTVLPVKLTGLEYYSIFLPKDSIITGELNAVYVLLLSSLLCLFCVSLSDPLSTCRYLSMFVFLCLSHFILSL